jgi:uncharacterized protein (TIGR03437 family)
MAKLSQVQHRLANPMAVRVGHREATVQYAGLVSAGLYQFNVGIPDLDDGDYPIAASIGGVRTATVARIRVQR